MSVTLSGSRSDPSAATDRPASLATCCNCSQPATFAAHLNDPWARGYDYRQNAPQKIVVPLCECCAKVATELLGLLRRPAADSHGN